MATRKIVLVRHGRSGHVVKGLLDHTAFLKWREAYEAAGLDPLDSAPIELVAAANGAGVLVASDAVRAIESARLLAPSREVIVSALLRELALMPPKLPRIRLPLIGWALAIGMRRHITVEEEERARAATEWLIERSAAHGEVVAVTHGRFRLLLAAELTHRGWRSVTPRRTSRHWSAWAFAAP